MGTHPIFESDFDCLTALSALSMESLTAFLQSNDISYRLEQHEEVFTVEAMMQQKVLQDVPGLVVKNLFVKDKKRKELWLVTTRHDLNFKLNMLAKKLGVKDFRMADEALMIELLGVAQGCATPMALLNDTTQKVNFVLDNAIMSESNEMIWSPPLVNDHSIGLTPPNFQKFLDQLERKDKVFEIDFDSI